MSSIAVNRSIGAVRIDCVIRESPKHKLGITRIPIEDGSAVTDHAYVEPKQVQLEFADGNAAATFAALVRLQETRSPFTLVTGLYVYRNMLIEDLSAERDEKFSKVLKGSATISEVIIVGTVSGSGALPISGGAQIPTKEIAAPSVADRVSGVVGRGDAMTYNVAPAIAARVLGRF